MVGHTFKHYRIIEKLGSGGMGDVYVAENIHLRNRVALKFLPPHLSRDEGAKRRFMQEAQSASALNHPNVCTVYDIDEAEDGQLFMAMALYEGQTLKQRLETGPLSIDEALDVARQSAEGLSAAHEKGIVHRDIKPANIFITDRGRAVILDFGLAKLQQATTVLTQSGATLGTVAYMSPEQTRGEAVDRRTDVWSLGVVLYEMLAGRKPFDAEYQQAIQFAILNTEPEPLTGIRPGIPAALDGIVAKTLSKDPDMRYQHVDELPGDLKAVEVRPSQITRSPQHSVIHSGPNLKPLVKWSIGLLIVTVVAACSIFVLWVLRPSEPSDELRPAVRYEMDVGVDSIHVVRFSPDGRYMAFGRMNGPGIYLKAANEGRAKLIAGTEDATPRAFEFSPDGTRIVYQGSSGLEVVSVERGRIPVELAPGLELTGGGTVWLDDETVVCSSRGGLNLVSTTDGSVRQITQIDTVRGEMGHHSCSAIASRGEVLYHAIGKKGTNNAYIWSSSTGKSSLLRENASHPRYVQSGHLVFAAGGSVVVAYDAKRRRIIGEPVPISWDDSGCAPGFSDAGVLAMARRPQDGIWSVEDGQARLLLAGDDIRPWLRISPDGSTLAYTRKGRELSEAPSELWTLDFARGVSTQRTFGGTAIAPVWSADGQTLFYASLRQVHESDERPGYDAWMLPADGASGPKKVVNSDLSLIPTLSGPSGKLLASVGPTDRFSFDGSFVTIDVNTGSVDRYLEAGRSAGNAIFSPDGRWLAYTIEEYGRDLGVWVTGKPYGGVSWRVASRGWVYPPFFQNLPMWSSDGKTLYLRVGIGAVGRVRVDTTPTFRVVGELNPAFTASEIQGYDLHPDGDRFLFVGKNYEDPTDLATITITQNWFDELRRIAPGE